MRDVDSRPHCPDSIVAGYRMEGQMKKESRIAHLRPSLIRLSALGLVFICLLAGPSPFALAQNAGEHRPRPNARLGPRRDRPRAADAQSQRWRPGVPDDADD